MSRLTRPHTYLSTALAQTTYCPSKKPFPFVSQMKVGQVPVASYVNERSGNAPVRVYIFLFFFLFIEEQIRGNRIYFSFCFCLLLRLLSHPERNENSKRNVFGRRPTVAAGFPQNVEIHGLDSTCLNSIYIHCPQQNSNIPYFLKHARFWFTTFPSLRID